MPIFQIQNWKFGLDTRRSELTSQPGTLETLQDAQINQGAEVEKRKAFVPSAASLGLSAFDANVFGLEVAGGDLVAFGSQGSALTPVGVTYIQCLHPTDSTKNMTAVLCSCSFGGEAFCVAQFGTEVYWYLCSVTTGIGQVIPASIAGQVLTTAGVGTAQTTAQIAAQMFNMLNTTTWQDAGVFVESLTATGFTLYTAFGVTWDPVVQVISAAGGQITTTLVSTGLEPVTGQSGGAPLTIYAGSKGSISTLNDVAGNTTYKLITSAVPFVTTGTAAANCASTATALQNAITTQAPASLGIDVSQTGSELFISSTTSLPTNYLTVSVSATADICFENMFFDCSGVAVLQTLNNIYTSKGVEALPTSTAYGGTGDLFGSITGAYAGYKAFTLAYGTYLWIPGANDTKLTINGGGAGNVFLASNYPTGVVVTWTTSYFHLVGKASANCSSQIFLMTDILASSAGLPLGSTSMSTIATQLTAIAAAINARSASTGFCASNQAATLPASGANTSLYISRKVLSINAASYSGIYFYCAITGIAPSGFASATAPSGYGITASTPAVSGRGTTYLINFLGTWSAGDTYDFQIVTPALTYDIGIGRITQMAATACMTLSDRVHVIAGSLWSGCENGDATEWEQQAAGAFQIDVSQQFKQADVLVSLAAYQGRIALFADYVIMIWTLDANPQNISMVQAMENIGTFCSLGPQSLGDLDVVFPSITGFRSLRVRDLSLNAYVNDLGSPIDSLVQADINTVGLGNLGATCGIVEPSANRYWLYLNGKIYVLSYFPAAKINAAWSVYTPTFYNNGVQTTFVPVKFIIYNSQVYFVATVNGVNYLFVFGGTNNVTYDTTLAEGDTPWLDMGLPAVRKLVSGLDAAMTNAWQFAYSMDYIGVVNNGGQLTNITNVPIAKPTFQLGSYSLSVDGFHIKLRFRCNAPGYSVLSALDVHYQKGDEK